MEHTLDPIVIVLIIITVIALPYFLRNLGKKPKFTKQSEYLMETKFLQYLFYFSIPFAIFILYFFITDFSTDFVTIFGSFLMIIFVPVTAYYYGWEIRYIYDGKVIKKLGIINAYYMPNGKKDSLYSSISPVNTFRIIFNSYFNAKYDILNDESYILPAGVNKPYKFIKVTDLIKE